ncbi:hypothetical protein BHE74_00015250, partial [Ensete ventricosum]
MPPYHYRKFRLSGRKLRASPSWSAWMPMPMPMPMPHYKVKKSGCRRHECAAVTVSTNQCLKDSLPAKWQLHCPNCEPR